MFWCLCLILIFFLVDLYRCFLFILIVEYIGGNCLIVFVSLRAFLRSSTFVTCF